ncbi:MAG: hypothetical protein NVS9B15_16560 [Acidobacteriaceae bacterium]
MRKINLGVNARTIHFAMPEQIADLFQGQAAIDKTRGTGMAKGVRSSWANGRPQELPVMPDNFKDSAAGKRPEGATQRQKDLAKSCARSYLSKITQDGDGDSSAQREGLGAASLAAPQVQTVVFPVDVFKAQRADLT